MYNHQLIASVEESTDNSINANEINQDPKIAVEEKKPQEEDSPLPYRYVEPEFYNE
jgi:hypothetical protein